jgi:hypothetical protein
MATHPQPVPGPYSLNVSGSPSWGGNHVDASQLTLVPTTGTTGTTTVVTSPAWVHTFPALPTTTFPQTFPSTWDLEQLSGEDVRRVLGPLIAPTDDLLEALGRLAAEVRFLRRDDAPL